MSGLAAILSQRGLTVVGTDPAPQPRVRARLEAAGIAVHLEQDGSRIAADTQLLVASAALTRDHPELEAARRLGIPSCKYAEMLGAILNRADGVAVAGTHGKTTTAAMIVSALRAADTAPGFLVGGFVPQLGASADNGASPIFVAEACEYDRSFLNLEPNRALITNIGADHLDVYGDIAGVRDAFAAFASRVPTDGALILPAADEALRTATAGLEQRTVTFAIDSAADYTARDVSAEGERITFDLAVGGAAAARVSLRIPGRHNVQNALAAIAVCADLGHPVDAIVPGLEGFTGVERRFEHKGCAAGVTVIDDYAHHPTEIRALLEGAAMRFPGQRLVVAFQPHQIARTRVLIDDFSGAFDRADLLVVTDIYAARDSREGATERSAADLVERIERRGVAVQHVPALSALAEYLVFRLKKDDILVTVGAGDVYLAAEEVLRLLARPAASKTQ
jgi:UDP-N-acetylmuramate--alanine ligase